MSMTITPREITYPEIPYDKPLIYLSISPQIHQREDGTQFVEAAMSMTIDPCRYLPDGTIDVAANLRHTVNCGAVFEQAKSDPALAAATQAIWGALQAYLTAKAI